MDSLLSGDRRAKVIDQSAYAGPLPCESKREGAGPAIGIGSEGATRNGRPLPLKLLAAMLAKQNSTAREKPVHSIKPT
jgi:hypothetical protein